MKYSEKELMAAQAKFIELQQGFITNLLTALQVQANVPSFSFPAEKKTSQPWGMSEREADLEALRDSTVSMPPAEKAALEDYLKESGFLNPEINIVT